MCLHGCVCEQHSPVCPDSLGPGLGALTHIHVTPALEGLASQLCRHCGGWWGVLGGGWADCAWVVRAVHNLEDSSREGKVGNTMSRAHCPVRACILGKLTRPEFEPARRLQSSSASRVRLGCVCPNTLSHFAFVSGKQEAKECLGTHSQGGLGWQTSPERQFAYNKGITGIRPTVHCWDGSQQHC